MIGERVQLNLFFHKISTFIGFSENFFFPFPEYKLQFSHRNTKCIFLDSPSLSQGGDVLALSWVVSCTTAWRVVLHVAQPLSSWFRHLMNSVFYSILLEGRWNWCRFVKDDYRNKEFKRPSWGRKLFLCYVSTSPIRKYFSLKLATFSHRVIPDFTLMVITLVCVESVVLGKIWYVRNLQGIPIYLDIWHQVTV